LVLVGHKRFCGSFRQGDISFGFPIGDGFEENLIFFIVKDLVPLSFVEAFCFRRFF
jgi:hypothetical protein